MTFGERLQTLRCKKALTQKELSEKSGIPFYTIIALEYNRTKVPLITTAVKLADFFKVSLIELIDGVEF